jgi:hypothetical protein
MSTLQSAQSPLIIFETIPVRYPLFADLGLRGLPAPSTGIRSTLTSSCLVGTLTCSRSVLTCLLPQPDRLRAHVYLSFTCTCPKLFFGPLYPRFLLAEVFPNTVLELLLRFLGRSIWFS